MADIRGEVAKALPFISATELDLLMVRLDHLGVQSPQDMNLLKERDLDNVLKVVPCRKLLNHFKSPGYNHFGSPSKPILKPQSYYQMNSASRTVSPDFISPHRIQLKVEEHQNSFVPPVAHSDGVPVERINVLPSVSSNTASLPMTVTPVILSVACTMVDDSPTTNTTTAAANASCALPILDQRETETLFSKDDNEVLTTFDDYSTVSNSHSPITIQSEEQDVLPTLDSISDVENEPNPQDSGTVTPEVASAVNTTLDGAQSGCDEIIASNDSATASVDNNGTTGSTIYNYELPVHKLSIETQDSLKLKVQLNVSAVEDLVGTIVLDVLDKGEDPSSIELDKVARAVMDAYPESLNDISSGKSHKPGYETLFNMLRIKVNSSNDQSGEKSCIEPPEPVKIKRPVGRPKGTKNRKRSLKTDHTDTSLTPRKHKVPSGSGLENYQLPFRNLPPDIVDCLKHGKPLDQLAKKILVKTIVADLLDRNCSPTQEEWGLIGQTVLGSKPGCTESDVCDFLQRLNDEVLSQSSDFKRQLMKENILPCEVLLQQLPQETVNSLTSTTDVSPVHTSSSLTSNHSNRLLNYEVPFEKLSSPIQKSLTRGTQMKNDQRIEFMKIVIHDIIRSTPNPTRDEIKTAAKVCINSYPDALQNFNSGKTYTGFKHLSFLKTFLDVAMKITGDTTLSFKMEKNSTARIDRKEIDSADTIKDEDHFCSSSFGISKNEMNYFLSLKKGLQTKSVEWNNEIASSMSTTYNLQRADISKGTSIRRLKGEWPYLFHEKGFLLHTRLLLGTSCLKKRMEQNLTDKLDVLFDFLACQQSMPDAMRDILRRHNFDDKIQTVVVLILAFFGEKEEDLLCKLKKKGEGERSLPEHPCITTSGTGNSYSVSVQKTVPFQNFSFTTAFIICFATYLVFELPYPSSLIHTLVFVQRCFAGTDVHKPFHISPEVSEKMENLLRISQGLRRSL